MTTMLTDGTIALRALEPSDLDRVYLWENDPSLWPCGNTVAPMSRQMLKEYIDNYNADIFRDRQLRLIITLCDSGEAIGTLDLFDLDPANSRCSLGIFIATAYRNRGHASRATTIAERYCADIINLHQLWVTVPVTNAASVTLFKNAGYTIAGRMRSWLKVSGRYHDVFLMQKFLVHQPT